MSERKRLFSVVDNFPVIGDENMDPYTLLLVLKDEWFAGFMETTFGMEADNPYHEWDNVSDEGSTD